MFVLDGLYSITCDSELNWGSVTAHPESPGHYPTTYRIPDAEEVWRREGSCEGWERRVRWS